MIFLIKGLPDAGEEEWKIKEPCYSKEQQGLDKYITAFKLPG